LFGLVLENQLPDILINKMGSSTKIFLIGMPGSGKTTISELLAEKKGLPFFDLDLIIEIMNGKPIAEIFEEKGEDEFRIIESKALLALLASPEPYVMATGGGTPCFFDHMEKLNMSGKTVFLDTPVDTLVARVEVEDKRPLLMDDHQNKIEALLNARSEFYKQSQYIIDTKGKSQIEITEEIATML
jgi:shikimate kinase